MRCVGWPKLFAAVLVVVASTARPARASRPATDVDWPAWSDAPPWNPAVVLFMPLRDYSAPPQDLFVASPPKPVFEGAPPHAEVLDAVTNRLEAVVRADPRVKWLDLESVRSTLERKPEFGRVVQLVDRQVALGREYYDNTRLDDAARVLEAARGDAEGAYLDVLAPQVFANIELLLGLVYLEQGKPGAAHVALRRMARVDPTRRFERGYYPREAEEAIAQAYTDVQMTGPGDIVTGLERTERLLARVGADIVVTGFVARPTGQPQLLLVAYDRRSKAFILRETIPVRSAPRCARAVDLALSRMLACLSPRHVAQPRSKPAFGRFSLDAAVAHGVYFLHPTRDIFHNIGFSLNAALRVRRPVELFAKLNLYSSLPDRRADLETSDLVTARFIAGGGVAFERGVFKGFVRPGVEVQYASPFTVRTSPDCKFFPLGHPRCPADADGIQHFDGSVLLGFNVAVGLAVATRTGIYVAIQTSMSLYFPFLRASDVNFLLGSELGLGFTF